MGESTTMSLLGILQRHGLTAEALQDMAHFCERQCTGSLTLHIVLGEIKQLENHGRLQLGTRGKSVTASVDLLDAAKECLTSL